MHLAYYDMTSRPRAKVRDADLEKLVSAYPELEKVMEELQYLRNERGS